MLLLKKRVTRWIALLRIWFDRLRRLMRVELNKRIFLWKIRKISFWMHFKTILQMLEAWGLGIMKYEEIRKMLIRLLSSKLSQKSSQWRTRWNQIIQWRSVFSWKNKLLNNLLNLKLWPVFDVELQTRSQPVAWKWVIDSLMQSTIISQKLKDHWEKSEIIQNLGNSRKEQRCFQLEIQNPELIEFHKNKRKR